jgi:hypothetical protein
MIKGRRSDNKDNEGTMKIQIPIENLNDEKSVFIVPKTSSEIPSVNLLAELQNIIDDPSVFQVKNLTLISSDVLLVTCDSIQGAGAVLKTILGSEKLVAKCPKEFVSHEAWLHNVSDFITVRQITNAVFKKYKEIPIQMQFIPYKWGWKSKRRMKIVKLSITDTLLKKIEKSPVLLVQWREKKISTFPGVMRCANCQLLGHERAFCQHSARFPPSSSEQCLDCSYRNQGKSNPAYWGDTNHPTDGDECPVKKRYISDWFTTRESVHRS